MTNEQILLSLQSLQSHVDMMIGHYAQNVAGLDGGVLPPLDTSIRQFDLEQLQQHLQWKQALHETVVVLGSLCVPVQEATK